MRKDEKEITNAYLWKSHVLILDLVDLVSDDKLRQKIKTKVLDVAHETQEFLKNDEK
ncbi:hypothetical protein CPT_Stills38 [Bacillus phage Stills]|uniref:Uncharacterized protein n=1 Tax=Bacillus phage Stills TaxID=1610833 RepID=A0A0E3T5J9_9CAUD|nr:hypothetical protein CPT_Stills38 [Bacillus phage Stills]AKC02666.1 hypothetical protein CPT_Stills38 [Bacillus phage Stills]